MDYSDYLSSLDRAAREILGRPLADLDHDAVEDMAFEAYQDGWEPSQFITWFAGKYGITPACAA